MNMNTNNKRMKTLELLQEFKMAMKEKVKNYLIGDCAIQKTQLRG